MNRLFFTIYVLSIGLACCRMLPATPTFDPTRHIAFDELKVGMKGYGRTVFRGTEVESFDVEIVSLVRAGGVKRDYIMIRCLDERFDQAKVVQGVSGSPVYFDDRIAGAMAFGYAYSIEPFYGVTPIADMLTVPQAVQPRSRKSQARSVPIMLDRALYSNLMQEDLLDADLLSRLWLQSGLARAARSSSNNADEPAELPLAVWASGWHPAVLQSLQQQCPDLHWQFDLTGGEAGESSTGSDVQLEPGSVIALPLVRGDAAMAAVGTVTDVIDEHVYAFGHPWNGTGDAVWPMATGTIHNFVNLQTISRKMGSALNVVGAIRADEAPGIYGKIGESAAYSPMSCRITWPYASHLEDFQFTIVQDELYSALLASVLSANCVLYRGQLPLEHTIRYQAEMSFAGLGPLKFENTTSGVQISDVLLDLQQALLMVLGNPWKEVALEQFRFEATVEAIDRVAIVREVSLEQTHFHPGDTIQVQVQLEARRSGMESVAAELTLPEDTPPGKYKLEVGSHLVYRRGLQRAFPHRFAAFKAGDVVDVLGRVMNVPRQGVYVVLGLSPSGIALQTQALPNLPPSRMLSLSNKARATALSVTRQMLHTHVPMEYIVRGGHVFDIEVTQEK